MSNVMYRQCTTCKQWHSIQTSVQVACDGKGGHHHISLMSTARPCQQSQDKPERQDSPVAAASGSIVKSTATPKAKGKPKSKSKPKSKGKPKSQGKPKSKGKPKSQDKPKRSVFSQVSSVPLS